MVLMRKFGRGVALASIALLSFIAGDARAQQARAAPSAAAQPIGVLYNGVVENPSPSEAKTPPEPCHEECFLLSTLVLRGSVSETISFELKGGTRGYPGEVIKVPLFGPPGQVRLDDVTVEGSPASIGFDGDKYHVFTTARAFTIKGKLTIGSDQMLSVPGPVVSVDARFSSGKCVEGEKLSGVTGAVLHFDPMTEASEAAKPKVPPVFRLARAIRFEIGRAHV